MKARECLAVGCDPGNGGAIAFVSMSTGKLVAVYDMPTVPDGDKGNRPDGMAIAALMRENAEPVRGGGLPEHVVIVERVHSMPRQGVASTFRFGKATGVLIGALEGAGYTISEVTPNEWKKHFGLTGLDKDAARLLARNIWPEAADGFRLKKHVDRADAALIARHAYETQEAANG